MTTSRYETDVVAWANEQARLIRAGQVEQLDLEHITEVLDDVGKPKLASSNTIRRYMSFEKLMDLIQFDRIYLCRADILEDKFEGHYTRLIYDIAQSMSVASNGVSDNTGIRKAREKWRKMTYINCWTRSCSDNIALWKIYGGTKNSVAIETTKECLEQELRVSGMDGNWEIVTTGNPQSFPLRNSFDLRRLEIHTVRYIDYNSHCNELAKKLFLSNPEFPFFHKDNAFKYEEEVRVICQPCPELFFQTSPHVPGDPIIGNGHDFLLYHPNNCPDRSDSCPNNSIRFPEGSAIHVDSKKLIGKIFVGPYADEWFYKLVKDVLEERYGFPTGIVEWSSLRFAPHERHAA
jgi:hypothetical protein